MELTDEAFYLLTSMHPHALRFFFTPTQWVSARLWQIAHGLAAFRALGWALSTASAALLGVGAARVAIPKEAASVIARRLYQSAVIAMTVIFAWLYGAILPFSPSYNLLGASGAYAAFGLFLLSINCEKRPRVMVLAAASGICLGFAVLSKFSAGIATAGLIVVLQAVLRARHAIRLRATAITILALIATLAIAIVVESSLREGYKEFLTGLELTRIAQGSETTIARLIRGGHEWSECLTVVASTYWGPIALACIAVVLRNSVVGCAAVGWFAYVVVALHTYVGGMDVYQTQSRPVIAAMAMMLVLTARVWVTQWRSVILAASLGVLPFAIAIGTGNPLPFQILLALASWGALSGALAFGGQDHALRVSAICLAVALPALLAAQIISSGYRAPYRLPQPLQAQQLPVNLGRLGTLKVDAPTARFVTEVRSAWRRCDLPEEMPFLGIYRLPGVALLVDAIPVATPWLFTKSFTEAALNGVGADQLKDAAIALQLAPDGARPELPIQLQSFFPSAYRFCGTFSLPFGGARAELWAPVAVGRTSTSQAY
ncbi:MAG TPA: hypothetical protein VHC91_18325 [Trinickia sp.]|uniref:hypothetical protein n=1 Tax=Trinickia sp. TaxID=2571163 RepID=UPI002B6A8885|nr:hypothetical protein [Trinickia sp.]HVW52314.1 hypothetical protein [Trinickia sp.]